MANVDTTSTTTAPAPAWSPLAYSSGVPMHITINPDSTAIDVRDHLSMRLAMLDAMLCHTYGESGEPFRNLNDSIQDYFMYGCHEIASECCSLINALNIHEEGA